MNGFVVLNYRVTSIYHLDTLVSAIISLDHVVAVFSHEGQIERPYRLRLTTGPDIHLTSEEAKPLLIAIGNINMRTTP